MRGNDVNRHRDTFYGSINVNFLDATADTLLSSDSRATSTTGLGFFRPPAARQTGAAGPENEE
jgi:hypothetical protein